MTDDKSPFTLTVDMVAPHRVTLSINCPQLTVDQLVDQLPRVLLQLTREHEAAFLRATDAALNVASVPRPRLQLGNETLH